MKCIIFVVVLAIWDIQPVVGCLGGLPDNGDGTDDDGSMSDNVLTANPVFDMQVSPLVSWTTPKENTPAAAFWRARRNGRLRRRPRNADFDPDLELLAGVSDSTDSTTSEGTTASSLSTSTTTAGTGSTTTTTAGTGSTTTTTAGTGSTTTTTAGTGSTTTTTAGTGSTTTTTAGTGTTASVTGGSTTTSGGTTTSSGTTGSISTTTTATTTA
uniref:Uncharacterized protein n=1 Tax=Panagrolaimus sp. JU765 TaxID=591449 RepID=A0AC34R298_9BILA